ncbi:uncharacterized protein, partial [Penaeus vannamei]|uniref:uncharacterized protein n=1 Tax=Penaeus vannamei TaxID=6689 RepID=UPI00387F885E
MDIPLNEESKNHMTFICKVKEYESFLEKKFPALEDARIIISYYFSSPAEDLVMKLTMEQAGRPPLGIFTYTFPEDLLEHHEVWVSQEVQIPSYSRIQPFKIKLSLSSFNSSTWAADELRVLGSAPTSQPLVNFTYPPLTSEEPEVNETSPSVLTNHTLPPVNVTSPPSVNASLSSNSSGDGTNQTSSGPGEEGKTEDSNVTANITPAPSSGDPDFSEHLGRLESVAQAIWDAFYVFLALFCACLVALVALIVRGRCR